jgi:nitrate reductase NapAB chaperone NapD
MAICSCIVHCLPGEGAAVAARLADLGQVEVHGGVPEDTLVVTVEDPVDRHPGHLPLADTMASLGLVPGVDHTVLVYHYEGDDINEGAVP